MVRNVLGAWDTSPVSRIRLDNFLSSTSFDDFLLNAICGIPSCLRIHLAPCRARPERGWNGGLRWNFPRSIRRDRSTFPLHSGTRSSMRLRTIESFAQNESNGLGQSFASVEFFRFVIPLPANSGPLSVWIAFGAWPKNPIAFLNPTIVWHTECSPEKWRRLSIVASFLWIRFRGSHPRVSGSFAPFRFCFTSFEIEQSFMKGSGGTSSLPPRIRA